jgi:hypothetical protein
MHHLPNIMKHTVTLIGKIIWAISNVVGLLDVKHLFKNELLQAISPQKAGSCLFACEIIGFNGGDFLECDVI